jgi:hypothetical protein
MNSRTVVSEEDVEANRACRTGYRLEPAQNDNGVAELTPIVRFAGFETAEREHAIMLDARSGDGSLESILRPEEVESKSLNRQSQLPKLHISLAVLDRPPLYPSYIY